jgi:hypothetical protein
VVSVARIRTIKPEAFVSESLASVSLTAERTFLGLLTQADDQGRHRDHPAIIHGLLWPLRPEHSPLGVEEDLLQLQQAGLICRYTGCDGRSYLHIVTWARHQKIDRPSASRMPVCPVHEAAHRCGACKQDACVSLTPNADAAKAPVDARGLLECSTNSPEPAGGVATPAPSVSARPGPAGGEQEPLPEPPVAAAAAVVAPARKEPGQRGSAEGSSKTREDASRAREDSSSGSRIRDPGSSSQGGADAPPPDPTARRLIAEYVAACPSRPPSRVLGHLGRQVADLLAEGIDADHVRAGLERFRAKPLSPAVLPSMVNEAMNAPARAGAGAGGGYRAWTNPLDPAAYGEDL